MTPISHEYSYLNLLQDVLNNGEDAMDRTGTGTRSLFGRQMRFNLWEGFPATTTKKLAWNAMEAELRWFLEGSGDNRRLAFLTHGDETKNTIWTGNANADYWKSRAAYSGDLGRVYGVQWRRWRTPDFTDENNDLHWKTIDQIAELVESLKSNPKNRRMILTAYNVGELERMALPPCHMFAQFHVNLSTNRINCQVCIRSNDLFLGAPFNIASYALLVHMLAQVTGREAGELIITIGDAHIYHNHIDQVKEQLSRIPYASPKLLINRDVKSIDDFKRSDYHLEGYQHHPEIKAPMAV